MTGLGIGTGPGPDLKPWVTAAFIVGGSKASPMTLNPNTASTFCKYSRRRASRSATCFGERSFRGMTREAPAATGKEGAILAKRWRKKNEELKPGALILVEYKFVENRNLSVVRLV